METLGRRMIRGLVIFISVATSPAFGAPFDLKFFQSYLNEKDADTVAVRMKEFFDAGDLLKAVEAADWIEYPTQLPEYLPVAEKFIQVFRDRDFRTLKWKDAVQLKELYTVMMSLWSMVNDVRKKFAPELKFSSVAGLVVDAGQGPVGFVGLLREFLSEFRNRLGTVPMIALLDQYFLMPGTPIFVRDFNHFHFFSLLIHLRMLAAAQTLVVSADEQTAHQEVIDALRARVTTEWSRNFRQLAGLKLAGVPEKTSQQLFEIMSREVFATSQPEQILEDLWIRLSTEAQQPELREHLLEQVEAFEQLLNTAKENRRSKRVWFLSSAKDWANEIRGNAVHLVRMDSILNVVQADAAAWQRWSRSLASGACKVVGIPGRVYCGVASIAVGSVSFFDSATKKGGAEASVTSLCEGYLVRSSALYTANAGSTF